MFDATALVPESGEDSPSGASLRGPHRLAAVESCERMWALRYFWNYRPTYENPWRLGGSLLHTCYQYYYASLMAEPPGWYRKQTLQDRLVEQASAINEPIRTQLLQLAYGNLHEYMQFYAEDRNTIRPIAIEEEFQARLSEIDPMPSVEEIIRATPNADERARLLALKALDNDIITCRSDLVYETLTNQLVSIMDYKSHGRSRTNPKTGRLTKWKEDGEYALNFQVLLNLVILRARMGYRVRDFVIQRVTRERTALGFYDFDRHPLTIPTAAYEGVGREARELVLREYEVMSKIDRGGKPSSRSYACWGRYGECDYRYVCMAGNGTEMQERLNSKAYVRGSAEEMKAQRARLRVVQ